MIKSEEKCRDLALLLEKDNNLLIKEAIGLLRGEQSFEGAIGLLTAKYDLTDDYSIKKAIEGFMNDLKDQAACPEVIAEIRKDLKPETISMLVSSCWQSGLNYSEFSRDLAEVFLKGDYVTAIECLTVIEESAPELSSTEKDEIIKIISEKRIADAKEKSELVQELLLILER